MRNEIQKNQILKKVNVLSVDFELYLDFKYLIWYFLTKKTMFFLFLQKRKKIQIKNNKI